MKLLCLVIAALALAGCATAEQTEYIVRQDGPRLSREDAQAFLVQQSLTGQVVDPLDAPLKVLAAPLPEYPEQLRRGSNALSGVVNAAFLLNADGSVSDVVLLGQPNSILAALCLDALLRWRFAPISRGGVPASQKLTFRFVFRLED